MKKDVEWRIEPGPVDYPGAVAFMETRVHAIAEAGARELIWLLEHPALYTAGTSALPGDLLQPGRLPVYGTGRGGQYTYHGPGQRIAYVLLDLNRRGRDVRAFVAHLEDWLIAALARLGVGGRRLPGHVGVWVETGAGPAKIAAIGVRLRRWVSYHGISLNVAPDLADYAGIVPCGIAAHGVTSLQALGLDPGMAEVDRALKETFAEVFGEAARQADGSWRKPVPASEGKAGNSSIIST